MTPLSIVTESFIIWTLDLPHDYQRPEGLQEENPKARLARIAEKMAKRRIQEFPRNGRENRDSPRLHSAKGREGTLDAGTERARCKEGRSLQGADSPGRGAGLQEGPTTGGEALQHDSGPGDSEFAEAFPGTGGEVQAGGDGPKSPGDRGAG